MKTRIIAIEGIDGSGKGLQGQLLAKNLRQLGKTVAEKSFPEYGSFFGRQLGNMLRGEGVRADQVDSRSMCLWYALDRWQSFKNFQDGQSDFLLLNRYVLSNAVYQSVREIDAGMEDNWQWVKELEHGQLGLPEPDLYVLIDVEPRVAQGNVDKKGQREYIDGRDVYESQRDLLTRARQRYLSIAQREQNFALIPCMEGERLLPPEEIAGRVLQALRRRGLLEE
jgi:dTMP kinase